LRFLIDMPITPLAVGRLEAAGHDAIHASNAGLALASDSEILETASAEDRIVVTADLDYPRLLALGWAKGPGLILFRGGSYSDSEMLALLDRVLARAGELDLRHSITVVDRARIRRRGLPIGR
jgi:predicted nuclease of predicted toxin-antitoxin system